MKKRVLYWLQNDLRISDNVILSELEHFNGELDLVYVIEPRWFKQSNYQQRPVGKHRYRFLIQSLQAFSNAVEALGQTLHVVTGEPEVVIHERIKKHGISTLVCTEQVGYYEQKQLKKITELCPELDIKTYQQDTLFTAPDLPFSVADLPKNFTAFRKKVEAEPAAIAAPRDAVSRLPHPVQLCPAQPIPDAVTEPESVSGGLFAAQQHCQHYFSSPAPACYKETRNELDGFSNTTKFSLWLAGGSISAKQVYAEVEHYEHINGANESTYWIKFELLWREYFKWHAKHVGRQLFRFKGQKKTAPLTTFNSQRFASWCQGTTPFPLVNAIMHELNETGYISNRSRQIAASCLVNEFAVDWRFGAAYFEQQLIDYDVAANWGNWQYIAGVGVDPRGGRHFHINKQTALYDPTGCYIRKWQGDKTVSRVVDIYDAADWPLNE
ncbi:DASH family cryptochrome [Pseudoalteromonas lipolytica]|uniref:Cryptochrome DASH n=1 Tax=Pseudoalteromonas lipolytica TaxID=570156 RepID=A0AAD0WD11_9GAMM|nr:MULTISPECIES: DASH family cryptochrome [Pseudoalteromonas]AXV65860.1 DASH family cryptochrome [Pseudoalteromonas donghaensis]QPL42031.1 DASH family cryptochrome [Pseudoalteromonas sp. A41-2]